MKTKICTKCGIEKDLSFFVKDKRNKDGTGGYCMDCNSKRTKIWLKNNPEKRKKYNHKGIRSAAGRFSFSKSTSKKRGYSWNISLEEYTKLISQICFYCEGNLNESGCGLDRIDNNEGYEINNVVPCCRECNTIKHETLTYSQMMEIKPFLVKWKNNLKINKSNIK